MLPHLCTVGIPVYNEETTVRRSLESIIAAIRKQATPVELVVCFNGTTDNSIQIVSEMCSEYPIEIIHSKKGKAPAIRALGQYAKGDVIIFTDADAIMDCSCIKELLRYYEDANVIAVTGQPVPWNITGTMYKILNARMLFPLAEIASRPVDGMWEKPFLHGRLYSVRKMVFSPTEELESMNTSIGDDTYLTHHIIRKYGRKAIRRAPEAQIMYLPVQSVMSWWKKWTRIWTDLDKLYRDNPQFKVVQSLMKTKIDWDYVQTLPIQYQLCFVAERILHYSGRFVYLAAKSWVDFGWSRLDDTKKVPDGIL